MGRLSTSTLPQSPHPTWPELPAATRPPERRGLRRDALRLLVSEGPGRPPLHTRLADLDRVLRPGDVLVVNRSATLPASLPAEGGLRVHLSTRLGPDAHIIEVRRTRGHASAPWFDGHEGDTLSLPDGQTLTLERPHPSTPQGRPRLWIARGAPLDLDYLRAHGRPIRYDYSAAPWPIEDYQTVFGVEPGSAEMPSAGRGFSSDLVARLERAGVVFAPVTLHCGVASLEAHEPPHEEYARVDASTLDTLDRARRDGHRVIAVGTTAVRALERARTADGRFVAFEGLTDALVSPHTDTSYLDALISGFHPPDASHVNLLASFATPAHLSAAYRSAAKHGYLSHEFGDLHLIWRDVAPPSRQDAPSASPGGNV